MPDCTKLSVVDAVETALGTVTELAEVHMNESVQRKREEYAHPVCFVNCYDTEELQYSNRVERAIFPMIVEIWAEGSAVQRTLENLRASVRKALYASSALRTLGAACRERRAEHLVFEDTDTAGMIRVEYQVQYHTNSVDPFSLVGF